MTKEVAARIGTPFFTTREGGTGLGVVIARTAIAQHHGTLEFSSIPGVGTTATIALPVAPQKRVSA
jgi:signal transduction histidine kinase